MWLNGESGFSAESCLKTGSFGIEVVAGLPSKRARCCILPLLGQLPCMTTFARFKYLMCGFTAFQRASDFRAVFFHKCTKFRILPLWDCPCFVMLFTCKDLKV